MTDRPADSAARTVRVGMYIDMRNPPGWPRAAADHYARWLERVVEGERLGADAVWVSEHHFFDDGYLPQCWTLAAAIAARTTRVRIGTAVALLPLHTSLETAEQVALVDALSGGRVEAGFGVGYRKPEYLAFGGDFKRRYGVYAHRIRELRELWGEQPGAERVVTPGPVQRPVPVWGGFGGPMGARLAGLLGMGLQSTRRALYDPYLDGLAEGGHGAEKARMAGSAEWFVTDDPERTWAEIEPHVRYRWESYNRYMVEGTRREHDPPAVGEAGAVGGTFVIGTADHVATVLAGQVAGLPVTDLYGWSDYPGIPDELIERHIELTFTELAPRLRSLVPPASEARP